MTIEPTPDFTVLLTEMTTRTPGCIDQENNILRLDPWRENFSVFVPDRVATSFGFKTFAREFGLKKAAGREWWEIPCEQLCRCLAAQRLYPVVGGASGRYLHLGDGPHTHEEEEMPDGATQYYSTLKEVKNVQV